MPMQQGIQNILHPGFRQIIKYYLQPRPNELVNSCLRVEMVMGSVTRFPKWLPQTNLQRSIA